MKVVCALISFIYFVILLKVMITNANSTHYLSVKHDYFAASDTVKQSDGFQVAFNFAPAVESNATLHFYAGTHVYGEGEPLGFDIELCTEEELASFYPIKKS